MWPPFLPFRKFLPSSGVLRSLLGSVLWRKGTSYKAALLVVSGQKASLVYTERPCLKTKRGGPGWEPAGFGQSGQGTARPAAGVRPRRRRARPEEQQPGGPPFPTNRSLLHRSCQNKKQPSWLKFETSEAQSSYESLVHYYSSL